MSRRDRHRPKPRSTRCAGTVTRAASVTDSCESSSSSRSAVPGTSSSSKPGAISRRSMAATRQSRNSSSTRSSRSGSAGYDQRPYKTLTTARGSTTPDRHAVYVISHVDIAPQSQGPPADALRSLAEASRKEPGNLRFDVVQHTMRGNHFTVVEGWRNQQALDAHVGCGPHADSIATRSSRYGQPARRACLQSHRVSGGIMLSDATIARSRPVCADSSLRRAMRSTTRHARSTTA